MGESNFESYSNKLTKDVNSHNCKATSDDLAAILNDHQLPLAQRIQLEQQVFQDERIGLKARLKLAQSVVNETCADGAYLVVNKLPEFPTYMRGQPGSPDIPGIAHPFDIAVVERHAQGQNEMAPIGRIGYFTPQSLDYTRTGPQPQQRPFIFGDLNNPYNKPTAQDWNGAFARIMRMARQRDREIQQDQNPSF
jgi:hypothetical protein